MSLRKTLPILSGAALLLLLAGCIQDQPAERDIPWSKPAGWEGTIPLPNAFRNE